MSYAPPSDLKTIADIYKRMTAAVGVNGAGPYPFVVDTGANQSVISAELATQLGLPAGDSQALNGVAGVQMTPTARANLQIGDRRADQVLLSVLPAAAIGGPGMLGLDQLDGGRLTLDFRRQTLPASTPGRRQLPGLGATRSLGDGLPPPRWPAWCWWTPDLAGIHITPAFLDSWQPRTPSATWRCASLAITRYPKVDLEPDADSSASPARPSRPRWLTCRSTCCASAACACWPTGRWPSPTCIPSGMARNLIDRPAILIGVDILSRFETVCLDFAHDQVRLRLPQES